MHPLGRYRWHVAIVTVVAVAFVAALFVVAETGRSRLEAAGENVARAHVQLVRLLDMQVLLLNAESTHRSFMTTGEVRYLEPLHTADRRIPQLASQLLATYRGKDPQTRASIEALQQVVAGRLSQMHESVAVYYERGPAAGLALTRSPDRNATMAEFRKLSNAIRIFEEELLERSLAEWAVDLALVRRLNGASLAVGLLLAALAIAGMDRAVRQRDLAAADLARQRDELEAQAAEQAAELTALHAYLQNVEEEERARLARGLHDELGGVLMAARMHVTWLQQHASFDRQNLQDRLGRIRQALDQGIDLKRRVVEELRPTLLDSMGLVAALRWQIEETCRVANLKCVEQLPDDEPVFTRAGAIALFRVVQEALLNVAKHARAQEVAVRLEISDTDVLVSVVDDGVGASPVALAHPNSHGLGGMRHRVSALGGRLRIDSVPGRGTRIRVTVPRANMLDSAPRSGAAPDAVAGVRAAGLGGASA